MIAFYNVVAAINLVIAVMMLKCGKLAGEGQQEFKVASRVLHVVFVLVSISMFSIQFEPKIEEGDFPILSPFILFLFYLIAHGFIWVVLLLFQAKYNKRLYFKHLSFILSLLLIYLILYIAQGAPQIYTSKEFIETLYHSPMLIARCVLLLMMIGSVTYGILLSHRASWKYNKRLSRTLSDVDFHRSILISKFSWSVKSLGIWALLTNFYTTPLLEVVSCSLIPIVFSFQLIGFRDFLRSGSGKITRLVTISGVIDPEMEQVKRQLRCWISRVDKPFTQVGISISDVANDIGVAKSRLSSYINSTETNFRSCINALRIEEAKSLLLTKDISISDIATRTGFCDLPAFSGSFKRATGLSPKAFRDSHNNIPNVD